METKLRLVVALAFAMCFTCRITAQQSPAVVNLAAATAVPTVINYSGTLTSLDGKPLSGIQGVTFLLYRAQEGGPALWMEMQNITPGKNGQYTATLGATMSQGLPADLFTSGEARWLAVQVAGQPEGPRVLLVAVPYALKAADAETVGGLPPSAFVLASPGTSSQGSGASAPSVTASTAAPPPNGAVTGLGTVNFLPLWDTTSDIVSSVVTQTGTGATAKIGINTTTPASTLDVKGGATVRGTLSLPASGVATATGGKSSQPANLAASSFNSGNSTAVTQTFQVKAEPTGNNTSSPSGTLNFLFGQGTSAPAETGLKIASNGLITFANGQTFPGTGSGTITGVTAGSGLTGGGNSGSVSLSLLTSCASGQVLQWNGSNWVCTTPKAGTITGVTAGADLTGGGTSGTVTLNLDTTKVPQLNVANTFTGNQTVNGNLSATGLISGSAFNIGSDLFAFGSHFNSNAFLGFAGNTTMTGYFNTAVGMTALTFNTSGIRNTAIGGSALYSNTQGSFNVATGLFALFSNTTGGGNTANGVNALYANTTNNFSTAMGDSALYSSTADANTAVGDSTLYSNTIGTSNTASGATALFANTTGNWNTASGYSALSANTTGSQNTADGFRALYYGKTGDNNSAFGYLAGPGSSHPDLTNTTAIGANAEVDASDSLVLGSIIGVNGASANTKVGIGTTTPQYSLDVHGTGNFTGLMTFAAGQTFPGTGTITGVTAGTDLTGGGTSGSVTLNVDTTKVVTGVLAGTDLTGGGTGGVQTLNLDTTKVPQLNAANTFTGNQTVSGNLSATGVVTGNSFNIGNFPFAFGSYITHNTFLGFTGNTTNTGPGNTVTGTFALASNTTGDSNTANGDSAMYFNTTGASNTAHGRGALSYNTTGFNNTAAGWAALYNNVTGSNNSALGALAGPPSGHPDLTNATAIGAYAEVDASNSMVLGAINGVNNAFADTNVGIGITAPTARLHIGAASATSLRIEGPSTASSGFLAASFGGFGDFSIDAYGNPGARFLVKENGFVGIGTPFPDNTLSVNGSADKPGGGSWGTFSDRRLKNLDGSFSAGLQEVMRINPVRYRYKEQNAMDIHDSGEHIGLVAQEVQKAIPEAVSENSKGYLLVNNDPIIWAMLNAIKEQQRQIQKQYVLLQAQSAALRDLKSELRRTRQTLQKSKAQVEPGRPILQSRAGVNE